MTELVESGEGNGGSGGSSVKEELTQVILGGRHGEMVLVSYEGVDVYG